VRQSTPKLYLGIICASSYSSDCYLLIYYTLQCIVGDGVLRFRKGLVPKPFICCDSAGHQPFSCRGISKGPNVITGGFPKCIEVSKRFSFSGQGFVQNPSTTSNIVDSPSNEPNQSPPGLRSLRIRFWAVLYNRRPSSVCSMRIGATSDQGSRLVCWHLAWQCFIALGLWFLGFYICIFFLSFFLSFWAVQWTR